MKFGFHHRRILFFFFSLCGGFVLLILRLYQIQVMQSHSWKDRGEKSRIQKIKIPGNRGTIYTREGEPLAITISSYSLAADPSRIVDPAGTAKLLSPILGIPAKELQQKMTPTTPRPAARAPASPSSAPPSPSPGPSPSASPAPGAPLSTTGFLPGALRAPPVPGRGPRAPTRRVQFQWLKRPLEDAQYRTLLKLQSEGNVPDLKQGVTFVKEFRRTYPQGRFLSQVLGFCGTDNVGLEGMEHQLNDILGGKPGERIVLLGPSGRVLAKEFSRTPPDGFHDVYLTIDREIQYYMEKELDRVVTDYKPKSAFAIAMDPFTGEVLGMSNRPTYDPNQWRGTNRNLWRNRSINELYEPGSVFKLVTVGAALQTGKVKREDTFQCDGGLFVHGRKIKCMFTHNVIDLDTTIAKSCNSAMMRMGLLMGQDLFYQQMVNAGFGQLTGIDIPGEGVGLLREVKKWSGPSLPTLSFGQEVGVTGIQMISMVSMAVNGGRAMVPYVIKKIQNPQTGQVIRENVPQLRARVFSEEVASALREMMVKCVKMGSGTLGAMDDYLVGGKTGTAQKLGEDPNKYVASFAGFVPADNPRIVVYVVLNEPQAPKVSGGGLASPVFKEVARRVMLLEEVPPQPGIGKPLVAPSAPPPALGEPTIGNDPVHALGNSTSPEDPLAATTPDGGTAGFELETTGAFPQDEAADSEIDGAPEDGEVPYPGSPMRGEGPSGIPGRYPGRPLDAGPPTGAWNGPPTGGGGPGVNGPGGYAGPYNPAGRPPADRRRPPPGWGQESAPAPDESDDSVGRYLDGYMTGGQEPPAPQADEVDETLLYRYEDH